MASRRQLPYGSWPSPVPASALVSGASNPTDVFAADGRTWWSQTRPDQGGRIQVLRRDPDGTVQDALPEGWNARTRVHEYGGAAWWVHDGVVFATSWADQRLYRAEPAADGGVRAVPLTPEPAHPHGLRYADGRVTPDGGTVVCVRESHPAPDDATDTDGTDDIDRADGTDGAAGTRGVPQAVVRNEIVALAAVPGAGDGVVVLVGGHDFVAAPRISPDGRRLAWISWELPDMPWDATTLWVGDLVAAGAASRLENARRVAGRPSGTDGPSAAGVESLLQPEWSAAGELFVVSDRSQWWNVYRVTGLDGDGPELVPVHPVGAEVGQPAWVFGQSRYVPDGDGTVRFTYSDATGAHLVAVAPDGTARDAVLPFGGLTSLRADGDRLVGIASRIDAEPAVVALALPDLAVTELRPSRDLERELGLRPESVSRPRRIDFPSAGGRTAHAWFYPPVHAEVEGPAGELPPLLVTVHGGPTASADPALKLSVQYWTSRGFAVADVDYGGSTGYGRAYRRLLDDAWGVVDVEDVCAAATWLAGQGLVDGARTAIRGGSAGGYTTLFALAVTDVFAAGASHFGVADLGALARDTHKFESRYLDRLVGPWPAAEDVYRERSPLQHVDGFDRPLIVLQGDEDAIVPPAQAELIVAALRARQVPHAYLLFAGEQHGFRKAENIIAAIEAELSFYGQVFGFTPAGDVPQVEIEFGERLASATGR